MFDFLWRRKSNVFYGNLAEVPLAEFFCVIHRHTVTGRVEITTGSYSKNVHCKAGAVIYASSTDPKDGLLPFLSKTKKITLEQLNDVVSSSAKTDAERGEQLVDNGILSPSELYEAIRARVEAIVWSCFWLKEGDLVFKPVAERADLASIHIPLRRVVMRGVRRAPRAKELIGRLGLKTTVYEPRYTIGDAVEIGLDKDEFALLGLVNGVRGLYQVCAKGPFSPSENAKLLYAFHILKLIERSSKQPKEEGSSISEIVSAPQLPESDE